MWRKFFRKSQRESDERAKLDRLESAEREMQGYRVRETAALSILNARHHRNHWRESIEKMIQGA